MMINSTSRFELILDNGGASVSQLHRFYNQTLGTGDIGTTILPLTLDSSIFLFLSPYADGLSHDSVCASGRIFLGFHAHTSSLGKGSLRDLAEEEVRFFLPKTMKYIKIVFIVVFHHQTNLNTTISTMDASPLYYYVHNEVPEATVRRAMVSRRMGTLLTTTAPVVVGYAMMKMALTA